ncbi:uncharacterized protein LOC128390501 [Panonychus citri]|uniref:uncharacterized protein LOC128390501 n=1 Tax=Panonychus citri TaxID=50023 RepID=UPI0023083057|nr:uncharacterized protein LOC128390501 [Panonychus citri]
MLLPKPSKLLAEVDYKVPTHLIQLEQAMFEKVSKIWLSYRHHVSTKTMKNRKIWYLSCYGLAAMPNGKAIRCADCAFNIELSPEVTDDFCVKMHMKQTFSCPFMQNHKPENRVIMIKIQAYFASVQKVNELLYPISVYRKDQNDPNSQFKLQAQFVESDLRVKKQQPNYPDFEDVEHRIYTFFYSQSFSAPSSSELMVTVAQAGFVCADKENSMFCFHCGYRVDLTAFYENYGKFKLDEDSLKIDHYNNSVNCLFIINTLNGETEVDDHLASTSCKYRAPLQFDTERQASDELVNNSSAKRSMVLGHDKTGQNMTNRQNFNCKKCYCNDINILYFPCYHAALCHDCSLEMNECFICSQPVEEMRKISLL